MQKGDRNKEILASLGLAAWNDMQVKAHETIQQSKETLLLAPTGSGKTLAYLLPVYHAMKKTQTGVQALVLVPSRELALQIEAVWKKMGTGFKVNTAYGGHLLQTELQNLSEPPALLVGTPGRIADHLTRGSFNPNGIHTLVLDEFDKSLALGFEKEMFFILGQLKQVNKRVLVSATAAVEIPEFTRVTNPVVLDYITNQQAAENAIVFKTVISDDKDKLDTLYQLLCYLGAEPTIVFCNYREATERTAKAMAEMDIENAYFHGGLEQEEREQTLARFRNGSVQFLIATDLAARGLDIPQVRNIVHYHIPSTPEEFIHRNGRTARMNATGTAYILLNAEERLPEYVDAETEQITLPIDSAVPPEPQWTTIYISGGKKDKLNKVDIAGFFMKVGGLQKDELGLLEVKDFISYAAVKRDKVKSLLQAIRDEKMKGQKYKIAIAR
ncbi:MAG: DEAD/DEAH box helicase [Flavipsychrobacter sp.]|nr:DEAD/DEAH box helicase [Flavipsychrobacter sp.]